MKAKHHDSFSEVFGDRRGKQRSDTILSHRSSDGGREDLAGYLADLNEQKFGRTTKLLTANRTLISERPLLGRLASELCRSLVSRSTLGFDNAVRHFLDATGVYPAQGGHLLVVTDQKPRLRGQGGGQTRSLHLWAGGNEIGPLACLEGTGVAVCGLEVTSAAWRRVDRGTWQSDRLAELGWKHCETCARDCPKTLRFALDETAHYIPFGAEMYRKMMRAVISRTVKHLAAGDCATVEEISALANRTYGEMLLPAAVACAGGAGESAVQWLLDARQWRSLRHTHGADLSALLTPADWRVALAPSVPTLNTDASALVVADDATFALARAGLVALLEERVGALTPAQLAAQLNI